MRGNKILLIIIILLIGTAATFWIISESGEGVSQKELQDFAIADTASIDRIYIADHLNNAVMLYRSEDGSQWMVRNDQTKEDYQSQNPSVNLLLKTIRRIKVQEHVPQAGHENTIKNIMATHSKVEIYQKGNKKPSKIYWVGNPTSDHYGTYMLLETPEDGKSSVPFIMGMPGFNGFLSTRFHADISSWRYSGMFDKPFNQIESLSLSFNDEPQKSFRIEQSANGELQLFRLENQEEVQHFDPMMVKSYLDFYKKIHFESFVRKGQKVNRDSVLNTMPIYTIALKYHNEPAPRTLEIYHKNAPVEAYDENDQLIRFDGERFWALYMDRDFVTLQNQHVQNLFVPVNAFTGRAVVNNSP